MTSSKEHSAEMAAHLSRHPMPVDSRPLRPHKPGWHHRLILTAVIATAAVVTVGTFGHGAHAAGSPAPTPSTANPTVTDTTATPNTSAPATSTRGLSTSTTRTAPTVAAAQRRLAALGYDPGPADSVAGARFADAVMAFQKVEGLPRTGRLSADVTAALSTATRPKPIVANAAATRVEISLALQVLQVWQDGELVRVLPVSTGSGRRYCVHGACEQAITPLGQFSIERKIAGPHTGPLGTIFWPLFFRNGVAVHGYPSVPATAASHGCVRVPMWAAPGLFEQLPVGTPIYVAGK